MVKQTIVFQKDWSIYFNSLPALSVISSRDPIAIISLSNATNLVNKDFSIFHVDGGLFKIAPVKGFIGDYVLLVR